MAIEDLKTKADLGRFITSTLDATPLSVSDVDGLAEQVTPSAWTPAPYGPGWSSFAPEYDDAGYRTLGRQVFLRGAVAGGGSGETIFTLPPQLCPAKALFFTVPANTGPVVVVVEPNGVVKASEVAWLFLNPISFWAAG